ncbi:MAG: hypothetical protein HQ522_01735 [Bacteroidetes bacterium]|nr:hypothetical protein [Bacteroidota bacterium]
MEFTDINKNLPLGENMGGIKQIIYFGLWDDVETWPTKPVAPATPEANAILTGELVMKTGKNLFSMYITDDTGEFSIESVGETDGKSYVEHLSLFHPGLQKSILGFMNSAKNDNLVLIATDAEGQQYIMGDAMRPAVFAGSPDGAGTAKETAGRKGVSMEFIYKTGNIYVYEGTVPLTPAI